MNSALDGLELCEQCNQYIEDEADVEWCDNCGNAVHAGCQAEHEAGCS